MQIKHVIDLLEVREKQALAFCNIYKEKLSYEDLQKSIDFYASNLAKGLIQKCTPLIYEEKFRSDLKRHLHNLGVDKPYSDKRVYEAFYNQLIELEKKINLLDK